MSEREWLSYLPDGRPIQVRRLRSVWQVACEERSASAVDLAAAMAEAVGLGELPFDRRSRAALRDWVAEHADRILAELG